MSVTDGQRANQQTFNDAFLSRSTDSDTVAVVGLNNPGSGDLIPNAQQKINDNKTEIDSNDVDIANLFATKENLSQKGVANGYVPLDGSAKIDPIYLDTSLLNLLGNWDASTNTPTVADGIGDPGDFYIVNVAGTQDLGSGNITFDIGDWCFYNDSNVWIKVINSNTVTSVNGQTGVVSLALNDITDVNIPSPGPSDDQKAVIYDDASGDYILGQPVGAGGSGGINYVINTDAELTADNHVPYKDAVQDTPVDGDGGSPLTTMSRTTISTDILRGVGSFGISKPAANTQGEGIHIELNPIDSADRYSRQQVSFQFKHPVPGSNTYVSGDLRVFVYDVDNASLIGFVENDDNGDILRVENEEGAQFVGFFNATDSLNYRLLLHQTTATATSAITVYDNVKLGPIPGNLFVNLEDWQAYSPTTNFTNTTAAGLYRRIGDSIQGKVRLDLTAAPGAVSYLTFSIPSGLTIDTNDMVGTSTVFSNISGSAKANDSGVGRILHMVYDTTTTIGVVYQSSTAAASSVITHVAPFAWGAGDYFEFDYEVPIDGWSASNIVSETEITQKTVNAAGAGNGGTVLTANVTDIDFIETSDSHDAWSGSQFTAPSSGNYQLSGSVFLSAPGAIGYYTHIDTGSGFVLDKIIGINGAGLQATMINWEGYLSKGDVLVVRADSNVTLNNNSSVHWIGITSLPDFTTYGVTNTNVEYVSASSDLTNYVILASTWGDLTSISLEPGTWDITSIVYFYNNGGVTAGTVQCGVSTNSGNNGAGLILGDNSGATNISATSTLHTVLPIPTNTVTHTVSTIYYLKSFKAAAITNQQVYYKIHARRV